MLGPMELFIIAVILLLLFGSKKLPELAKSLGGFMNEFNKAKDEAEKETKKAATSKKKK